jgi:Zn-dependent alcohol dehydrogenase
VKAIHELTDGGADIAVDSFGGDSTTAAAVKSLRETGTAILVGLAPEGATAPINMVDLVRRQKTLVGSYYGSVSPHESFSRIVDFYLKGELDLESLVTRRYQLEQINEGFDALARGEDGRGVIVF